MELAIFPILFLFFFMFVGTLSILGTIFWIWMIIDCATNEPSEGNDKLIWILIIIFAQLVGALIYFFMRRPQRPDQAARRQIG